MTLRDLPKKVSEPTYTPAPTVTASLGQWVSGLQDHITDDEKHRMMLAFGLTIDPDLLHVNGRVVQLLDENQE